MKIIKAAANVPKINKFFNKTKFNIDIDARANEIMDVRRKTIIPHSWLSTTIKVLCISSGNRAENLLFVSVLGKGINSLNHINNILID